MERSTTVGRTAFGFALDHLMRFAWDSDAVRRDLFSFLRSPWSGLPRRRVDFVEGRLRGRAINEAPAVEASVTELLGGGLQAVELLRAPGDVRVALAETVRRMVVAAHGLEARGIAPADRLDLAAARAVLRVLDDVADLQPAPSREELRGLLLRARVDVREDATARVLVCDLRAARTLDADLVIVLGLEQGGLASRSDDAFLPDGLRDALGDGLQAPEAGDLERHLLYVALARGRQRVVVCRRVASDDGRPLEPSPLWHDVVRAAGGAAPVVRRGLADVAWTVAAAPTPRERARAVSRLAADDSRRAERIADADGLTRRLRRARNAYQRPTRIRDPQVLADLAALDRFPVTALERFGDCSSWWFVERHLNPRDIDAAYDARLAGTIAHAALQRFYKGLPATFGKDRLEPGDADQAEERHPRARRRVDARPDAAVRHARGPHRGAPRGARPGAVRAAGRGEPLAARRDPPRGRLRRRQLGAGPQGGAEDRGLRGGGQDRPHRHRPDRSRRTRWCRTTSRARRPGRPGS